MKKTKLTRSLLAACSIVALSAVMYGCVHSGDSPPPAASYADAKAGKTYTPGTYKPDAALIAAFEAASAAEIAAAAGTHQTGDMITFAGLDITCDAGPCSVTINDNDTFTVTGTISTKMHVVEPVDPGPDPALVAAQAAAAVAATAASAAADDAEAAADAQEANKDADPVSYALAAAAADAADAASDDAAAASAAAAAATTVAAAEAQQDAAEAAQKRAEDAKADAVKYAGMVADAKDAADKKAVADAAEAKALKAARGRCGCGCGEG